MIKTHIIDAVNDYTCKSSSQSATLNEPINHLLRNRMMGCNPIFSFCNDILRSARFRKCVFHLFLLLLLLNANCGICICINKNYILIFQYPCTLSDLGIPWLDKFTYAYSAICISAAAITEKDEKHIHENERYVVYHYKTKI